MHARNATAIIHLHGGPSNEWTVIDWLRVCMQITVYCTKCTRLKHTRLLLCLKKKMLFEFLSCSLILLTIFSVIKNHCKSTGTVVHETQL